MVDRRLKLPHPDPEFGLWRLIDPDAVLNASCFEGAFEKISSITEITPRLRNADFHSPLLFIHGVEYGSPTEVIRDLVQPFLKSMYGDPSQKKAVHRDVYFISWNSALIGAELRQYMQSQTQLARAWSFAKELSRCPLYFRDVERRAALAGEALIPFIIEWCSDSSVGPTVVSHSLGAKVWADALKSIATRSAMLARPGIWWNLQPALARRAFTSEGEYALVAQMYQGGPQARAVTWYSRFDFVLSTLFWIAKGSPALGQFGCPKKSIPQRDVTKWVGEAHGMNHISGRLGTLFQRASRQITDQARELGII